MFMIRDNAKNEAPGAWRDKERGGDSYNTNSSRRTGSSSKTARNQPLGTNRTNWQGADFFNWSGGGASGKILKQLIEETRHELIYHTEQVKKLSERLQGLEVLDLQLNQKTEE